MSPRTALRVTDGNCCIGFNSALVFNSAAISLFDDPAAHAVWTNASRSADQVLLKGPRRGAGDNSEVGAPASESKSMSVSPAFPFYSLSTLMLRRQLCQIGDGQSDSGGRPATTVRWRDKVPTTGCLGIIAARASLMAENPKVTILKLSPGMICHCHFGCSK